MEKKLDNIAILWDVENVTPSTDSNFVHGLLDFVNESGKLTLATAFADWTRPEVKKTAEKLSENPFEMIHVPKAKKNSSDLKLVSYAIEVLFQYRHITKYIIVTGDVDFRHLLITLRKHGKEILIICDSKSANEDLLELADSYKDFRDLIPDYDNSDDEDFLDNNNTEIQLTYEKAADYVREAVSILLKNKKKPLLGAVKVRVKLLNESFREKELGHKTWKSLIIKLSKKYKDIKLRNDPKGQIIEVANDNQTIPIIFKILNESLDEVLKDANKNSVNFSLIAQALKDKNINIKEHGYSKIKKIIEAAEKRGILIISGQNVKKNNT
jgi:predicted nuclease of predicted toxin-antitoxin system